MNQFDIFTASPPGWGGPHPAVIVSHPARVARKEVVEVVMCSSKRMNRPPEHNEMILDNEDGLDWPTLCKCDVIYAVPKSEVKGKRGRVTRARQRKLIETIIASHGWVDVM